MTALILPHRYRPGSGNESSRGVWHLMQSLINISSSITITVALPRDDEQDVLSFISKMQLTGSQLGQWRSIRIERMYCAEFYCIPPPTAASLLLPLRPASATLVSWIRFTAPPADWLGRMRGK